MTYIPKRPLEGPIPEHASKRPLLRGERIVSASGKMYEVVRTKRYDCTECGGTGYEWKVQLRGEFKKFWTTLKKVAEAGYVRAARVAREEKHG